MCGLCGIAGQLLTTDQNAFKLLLFLAELRGEDATGVIRVGRGKEKDKKKGNSIPLGALRQTVPASHFLYEDVKGTKDKILWGPKDTIAYLGHARFGTIGAKTNPDNAHPFSFPNVIGMHNGTITKKFKHTDEYETDSEALYRNINDYGLEAALNEIESFSTAYALTYIDKKNYTLNLIRNDKRPLYFAVCDSRSAVAWASEDWMLKAVINRMWPNEKPEVMQPLPDVHFEYDLLQPRFWEHPKTQKLEIKKTTYTHTTYPIQTYKGHGASRGGGFEHWGAFQPDDWDEDDKTLGTNIPKPSILPAINPGTMITDLRKHNQLPSTGGGKSKRLYFHTLGADVPRLTFQKILDRGCGVCGGDRGAPDIDDPLVDLKIGWLHETNFICEACQEDSFAKTNLQWTKITVDTNLNKVG